MYTNKEKLEELKTEIKKCKLEVEDLTLAYSNLLWAGVTGFMLDWYKEGLEKACDQLESLEKIYDAYADGII